MTSDQKDYLWLMDLSRLELAVPRMAHLCSLTERDDVVVGEQSSIEEQRLTCKKLQLSPALTPNRPKSEHCVPFGCSHALQVNRNCPVRCPIGSHHIWTNRNHILPSGSSEETVADT